MHVHAQDPKKRANAQQLLKHDWLVKESAQGDTELDSVVLKRMRQFAQVRDLLLGQPCLSEGPCYRPRTHNQSNQPSELWSGRCWRTHVRCLHARRTHWGTRVHADEQAEEDVPHGRGPAPVAGGDPG